MLVITALRLIHPNPYPPPHLTCAIHQILDVPKLQDAQYAATNKSMGCTLILTEGDSAMALAVAGLEVVGRQVRGIKSTVLIDCHAE